MEKELKRYNIVAVNHWRGDSVTTESQENKNGWWVEFSEAQSIISEQKAEIERLRKVGNELSQSHEKAMASLGTYGEHPLIESWYRKAVNNWNALTKKEGNNG